MKDVSKYMDFDVNTSLKGKSPQYNVTVTLENEVSSQAREAAIALTGALVRNYYAGLYPEIKKDEELAEFIKNKLNRWLAVGNEQEFVALQVNVGLKRVKGRAA